MLAGLGPREVAPDRIEGDQFKLRVLLSKSGISSQAQAREVPLLLQLILEKGLDHLEGSLYLSKAVKWGNTRHRAHLGISTSKAPTSIGLIDLAERWLRLTLSRPPSRPAQIVLDGKCLSGSFNGRRPWRTNDVDGIAKILGALSQRGDYSLLSIRVGLSLWGSHTTMKAAHLLQLPGFTLNRIQGPVGWLSLRLSAP